MVPEIARPGRWQPNLTHSPHLHPLRTLRILPC